MTDTEKLQRLRVLLKLRLRHARLEGHRAGAAGDDTCNAEARHDSYGEVLAYLEHLDKIGTT